MGDPRKPKKTYSRPRRMWTTDQLSAELYLVGTYGLRNKREALESPDRRVSIEKSARALLSLSAEARSDKETQLLNFLNRLGLVNEGATLDDILNLKIEDLLERSLQNIIIRKTGNNSPYFSRQLVVHRHVSMGNRFINLPGYLVKKNEEQQILRSSQLHRNTCGTFLKQL